VVANKHGENLMGILHHAGSNKVVVLCHGFAACKVLRMDNIHALKKLSLVPSKT
jgi:hypothetical protein